MATPFSHETLFAYQLALSTARWVRSAPFPRGDADLKKQARRAADAVVLNIAEGLSFSAGSRRQHLDIAKASAAEVAACLDLAELPGSEEQRENLRRVRAMLHHLR